MPRKTLRRSRIFRRQDAEANGVGTQGANDRVLVEQKALLLLLSFIVLAGQPPQGA
jgi:hypothetical protein